MKTILLLIIVTCKIFYALAKIRLLLLILNFIHLIVISIFLNFALLEMIFIMFR